MLKRPLTGGLLGSLDMLVSPKKYPRMVCLSKACPGVKANGDLDGNQNLEDTRI